MLFRNGNSQRPNAPKPNPFRPPGTPLQGMYTRESYDHV